MSSCEFALIVCYREDDEASLYTAQFNKPLVIFSLIFYAKRGSIPDYNLNFCLSPEEGEIGCR